MSKRLSRFGMMSSVAGFMASVMLSGLAQAHARPNEVTVEVIDEHGATFSQMPVRKGGDAFRAYLQAERGAQYRIRVANRSGERVGVVVAVDGRNIISGARSDLANGEPMYILGASDTGEYSGWRTNLSEVHEFYFTDWKESYAEAFGDRSARGVIAVAVYREKERPAFSFSERDERARASRQPTPQSAAQAAGASAGNVASDKAASAERSESKAAEPGTGYGDRRDEPAVRVAFEAQPRASSRVFLKYEWRETLCDKGIIDCSDSVNRFWPDTLSFAPPPPRM
jgi:hypothetical protein